MFCFHLKALGEHVKEQEQKQKEQERRMAQEMQEVQRWKATVAQLEAQLEAQAAQQSAQQSAKHHAEAALLKEQTAVHHQQQERLRIEQEQLVRDQQSLRQSKEAWDKRNAEARYMPFVVTRCYLLSLVVTCCPSLTHANPCLTGVYLLFTYCSV
jgi:hypothetical protein